MSEIDFGDFDKLLLELVFQNEQESENKRTTKELVERYRAKIIHEKQQVLALRKEISLNDEIILDLQRYERNNDSLVTYTSTSAMLEREKEFLQIQLESEINTSENDNKNDQESVNKCKEILKQHEDKYREFTFAKEYHAMKEELDNVLNIIQKHGEQQEKKARILQDISEPALFGSYIDWSLRLATLRKSTNENIHCISQTSHTTSEMMQKIDQLEQKIKRITENTKDISDKENETGRKESNMDHTTEFQQVDLNSERTRLNQSKEKKSHLLHLPGLPKKLMRPVRETKLSVHFSDIEADNGRNVGGPQNSNSSVSNQDPSVEMDTEELLINDGNKDLFPKPTNLHCQGQLRFGLIQKQIHSKPNIKETEVRIQQSPEVPDTSKDSGYVSQGNSASFEDMDCTADGGTSPNEVFALPKIPSPFIKPDPPSSSTTEFLRKCERNKGKKAKNVTKSTMDLFSRNKGQEEASPCLNLFKTSTPKTPNLCSFESFSTVRFQDQQESFTSANTNTPSPVKDIGNLFQKMEGDDEFAFFFPSKSSQASDDDKEDFGFMLPFGQDARNSMEVESAPNQTAFSFF
ncbi:protein SIX6OS1 isoform 2-T2 [Anomaloglossus baeobatrachus]|uniref:protein SIX6OS1 isoform X2 n=1 Tax=Anomaloglossus baeobatrachus TaxID=238106 RepID=UPI003F501FC7